MANARVGDVFTFQALFLNTTGTPIAVSSPTIEVFWFDSSGTKIVLVSADTAMTPVSGDVGRYKYSYTIYDSITAGYTMYAVMRGTDPSTGFGIVTEQEVSIMLDDVPTMTARFIR